MVSPGVRVRLSRRPARLTFRTADGRMTAGDEPACRLSWSGAEVRGDWRLHAGDHFFGMGERGGPLDKRGSVLLNWNQDVPDHEPWTDPLYQAHPMTLVVNGCSAYGVFLDDPRRSWFDFGKTSSAAWSFGVEGGELNYYFLTGPSVAEVLGRYAALVGPTPLPPRWALGYHQCRWGYKSAARIRRLAQDFRRRRIPCDALWLDIDHMDGYRCFTWNRRRFPQPQRLVQELRRQGFRTVVIVDPGIKREPGYAVYDEGAKGGHFCRGADGKTYVGEAWPGRCVFPDFTRPATRAWWGSLYRGPVEDGVAGFWNDMNEPADFSQPEHTPPLSIRMHNDGEPSDHRRLHNVYGMQMARATFEGLGRLRPDKRPFVLTRAGFAGVQRYAAVWTGDNQSRWEHLRMSIPMLLNMGLSNIVFCGADIGGFGRTCSAELFTRWLQVGIFYPFCRVHTAGGPEQDPLSYGPKHERLNRRAIELRYRLLPYLYTEFEHAAAAGLPLLRPLLLDFPRHPAVHRAEHEFMFGRQLLAAPVLEEGARVRSFVPPAGDWYEFETGAAVTPRGAAGNGTGLWTAEPQQAAADPPRVNWRVTLDSIPLFARGGAVVPMQPVRQFVDEAPPDPLILRVFPGTGRGWCYLDDGVTTSYRQGAWLREEYAVDSRRDRVELRLHRRQGEQRFAPRSYLVEFMGVGASPLAVMVNGARLRPCRAGGVKAGGWRFERRPGVLRVALDALEPGAVVEWRRRR